MIGGLAQTRTSLLVVEVDAGSCGQLVRTSNRSLFLRRGAKAVYRRPLIATDLRDARSVSPAFELFDPTAAVAILSAYRIPFQGLRMLPDTPRLLRAMEVRTREAMTAFVRSSALDRARVEMLIRHGDVRKHVLHEIRSRDLDLVVLAFERDSYFARLLSSRLVARILGVGSCDVIVVRNDLSPERGCHSDEHLQAVGPW